MFATFSPPAREAVVRAALLASDAGRGVLGTDFLLLGLAEVGGLELALEPLGVTAAAVRAEISSRLGDRELLAAIGIDLDEVRRRAASATSTRLDDPGLWRMSRSRLQPLRVELLGPAHRLPLSGRGRKVIEVAMHYARRRHARVAGEDLLIGLLADGSNESVRILHRLGIDGRRLWSDLRPWHTAA